MKLHMKKIENTNIITLESEDGGSTMIGPVAQLIEAGCFDEDEVESLDVTKWAVIDMVEVYQVDSLEEALEGIEAEIVEG